MNKKWNILVVVVFLAMAFVACATNGTQRPYSPQAPVAYQPPTGSSTASVFSEPASGADLSIPHNITKIRDISSEEIEITLMYVRATPIGRDTKGLDLITPQTVELYSGIAHRKGVKAPFTIAPVVDGTSTFRIKNPARGLPAGKGASEHIWGRINNGQLALVHDPADEAVVYEERDPLQTLAIGFIAFPDRPTILTKSLGMGKIPAGVITIAEIGVK
jgi:hypothetical protein